MSFTPYCYEYPRPAVSVDVVVIRRPATGPEVLLIQRGREPFAGHWALPGGFLDMQETLEESARRELREETGLEIDELQAVGPFSAVERDPRGRVISFVFAANFGGEQLIVAGDDARNAAWQPLGHLPPLAFDHEQMIHAALATLQASCHSASKRS